MSSDTLPLDSPNADDVLKKILAKLTSPGAKMWDMAIKGMVPLCVACVTWVVVMERSVTDNRFQIKLLAQAQELSAGPNEQMRLDMGAIRGKMDEIAERLARVEALIEK